MAGSRGGLSLQGRTARAHGTREALRALRAHSLIVAGQTARFYLRTGHEELEAAGQSAGAGR